MRRLKLIIFVAQWCTYGVAILFEPIIHRFIVGGSGKKLHGLVVRILTVVRALTAVRVLIVGAFQNKIINSYKVIPYSSSLIVQFAPSGGNWTVE